MSIETKTMYYVEKFLPPECPKCRARFIQQNQDFNLLLDDMVGGQKKIRETDGYHIIACQYCGNFTACLRLESYQLADKAKAEILLKEGFVNFQQVTASGNMTQDHHTIYMKMPDFHVMAVKCEE